MADPVKSCSGSDPTCAAQKVAVNDADEEKKPTTKGDCRACGKASEQLTTCLCFGSADCYKDYDGGAALCDPCTKGATRCVMCQHLICTDYNYGDENCRSMEKAIVCGYDEDYGGSPNCGAAICAPCAEGSGWKDCFCRALKFCSTCSLNGRAAFHRCNTCGTLYCADQKGDCGSECFSCQEILCCVCLGVNDPRSLKYCAGCKPPVQKKSRRDNSYSYDAEYGSGGSDCGSSDRDSDRDSDGNLY